MRTPAEALGQVRSRLERTWSQVLAGVPWARELPLGTSGLTGALLADTWADVHRDALAWEDWLRGAGPGVALRRREVTVHRSTQHLPSALVVDDIDTAARLLGDPWPRRLAEGRRGHARFTAEFPDLVDVAGMLRAVLDWSDTDVDLLCRAAAWFAAPHPAGLTARQVPVEGMGTKWLDKHRSVVRRLAGLDDLGLVPGRPQRVHLTYLDPAHLAAGGRRHDVATAGDVDTLAYRPRLVLISENRDTAQNFPAVPGGIAVEGDGTGPGAVPHLTWVRDADEVVYWGDMDATGLEILNGFRAALGERVRSVLMTLADYEAWRRYGVDHDHDDRPLKLHPPRVVEHLTSAERALYDALLDPTWPGPRRIEQERIPLTVARQRLDVTD